MDRSRRRFIIQLTVLTSALILTFFAAVVLGAVRLPVRPFFQVLIRPGVQPAALDLELRKIYSIIWHIRVPRAAAGPGAG